MVSRFCITTNYLTQQGSCILEESKEHVSRMSLSDLFSHLDKMETGNQCVKFIDLLVEPDLELRNSSFFHSHFPHSFFSHGKIERLMNVHFNEEDHEGQWCYCLSSREQNCRELVKVTFKSGMVVGNLTPLNLVSMLSSRRTDCDGDRCIPKNFDWKVQMDLMVVRFLSFQVCV